MKWNNVKEENEALKEKVVSTVGVKSEQHKSKAATRSGDQDLKSGLELLDLDFVLGVIENTESVDKNDIVMRKIAFNEVLRRESRHEIASSALKVYAVDEDKFYGKDIQCQAMQELAQRTSK
ncbi:MAG: hypothetical protein JW912_08425 [Sedimentisphaerales bacterium]|nr:hypothetical protein [Sedimentisphaerales bacterium]